MLTSTKLTNDNCSYYYIGGFRDDNANATNVPIAFEKPAGDGYCNVLFIDGHVEGLNLKYSSATDVIKHLHKQHKYDDKTYQKLLSEAKKLDAETKDLF